MSRAPNKRTSKQRAVTRSKANLKTSRAKQAETLSDQLIATWQDARWTKTYGMA